jgi:hypothetical protein
MQVKHQSQSELKVLRDTHAIEAPKIPVVVFNPVVLRPLILDPIKIFLSVC